MHACRKSRVLRPVASPPDNKPSTSSPAVAPGTAIVGKAHLSGSIRSAMVLHGREVGRRCSALRCLVAPFLSVASPPPPLTSSNPNSPPLPRAVCRHDQGWYGSRVAAGPAGAWPQGNLLRYRGAAGGRRSLAAECAGGVPTLALPAVSLWWWQDQGG